MPTHSDKECRKQYQQLKELVRLSALHASRKERFLQALEKYEKGCYFGDFLVSDRVRTTFSSMVRYVLGLDGEFKPDALRRAHDRYLCVVSPVLNLVSAWDEVDGRIIDLFAYEDFNTVEDNEGLVKKEEIGWDVKGVFVERLGDLILQEPDVDAFQVALRVCPQYGISAEFLQEKILTKAIDSLFSTRDFKVTSSGRFAVDEFRKNPEAVFGALAEEGVAAWLYQAVAVTDVELFRRHLPLFLAFVRGKASATSLAQCMVRVDAPGFRAEFHRLAREALPAKNRVCTVYYFAFFAARFYSDDESRALATELILSVLVNGGWDQIAVKTDAVISLALEICPQQTLDAIGPMSFARENIWAEIMPPIVKALGAPAHAMAVQKLCSRISDYDYGKGALLQNWCHYLDAFFSVLTPSDLAPFSAAISAWFDPAAKNAPKAICERVAAYLDPSLKPAVTNPKGKPLKGSYGLGNYLRASVKTWVSEALAEKEHLPQPITKITAGTRDEEFEVCGIRFEDGQGGCHEIAVAPGGYPSIPRHEDDLVSYDEGPARSNRLLLAFGRRFGYDSSETETLLGWGEGLLWELRERGVVEGLFDLVETLRAKGVDVAPDVALFLSSGGEEDAADLAGIRSAVDKAAAFMDARPGMSEEFIAMAGVTIVRSDESPKSGAKKPAAKKRSAPKEK